MKSSFPWYPRPRKNKDVIQYMPPSGARPLNMDQYLALPPTQRAGAYVMAELMTDIIESIKTLQEGQK